MQRAPASFCSHYPHCESEKVPHLLTGPSCGAGDTPGCPVEFGQTWQSKQRSAYPACSSASSVPPHRPPYSYTRLDRGERGYKMLQTTKGETSFFSKVLIQTKQSNSCLNWYSVIWGTQIWNKSYFIIYYQTSVKQPLNKHRKQAPTKGLIWYKQAETEIVLLRGHVEPRRGIPHTHPATVTCDSQSSSTGQQIKTQAVSTSMWGVEQECRKKRGEESREKGAGLVRYISWWQIHSCSLSLPLFSFASSILHPPLLSQAVTPARCTSLAPYVAFLASPEKSLVKWQWTKSCWLAPGSSGERRSREGKGISGLVPTSGHSSVNCCELSVARLSAALSHEWRLASGWDYCAVVAPLWSDTLSFLAHREKEAKG